MEFYILVRCASLWLHFFKVFLTVLQKHSENSDLGVGGWSIVESECQIAPEWAQISVNVTDVPKHTVTKFVNSCGVSMPTASDVPVETGVY